MELWTNTELATGYKFEILRGFVAQESAQVRWKSKRIMALSLILFSSTPSSPKMNRVWNRNRYEKGRCSVTSRRIDLYRSMLTGLSTYSIRIIHLSCLHFTPRVLGELLSLCFGSGVQTEYGFHPLHLRVEMMTTVAKLVNSLCHKRLDTWT